MSTKIFKLTGCGSGDGQGRNIYKVTDLDPYVMDENQEMVIASSDWEIYGDIYMYGNVSLVSEDNPVAYNRNLYRTLSSKLNEPLNWVDFGEEYHMVIPHRLGRHPFIRILDSDNREMEVEIIHINSYFTRLKSNLDVSGTLYVI